MTQRFVAIVPTYDNPRTIRGVVSELRMVTELEAIIVVDDGGSPDAHEACETLARDGLAVVLHHPRNRGKGGAVKTGLLHAEALGATHAVQIDADGQHDLRDVRRFIQASRENPSHLVLGAPEFDHTAPQARLVGRRITNFWVRFHCGGDIIQDAMCGFRIYPVASAARAKARGEAMDFDPEIAVRMVWAGTPVLNLSTRVRYVSSSDGGVSHFRGLRDNALISWMHTRLGFWSVMLRLARLGPPRLSPRAQA